MSPHSVQGSKFSISDENNSKCRTPSPPQLNVYFQLIKFHFPQLVRMCCIELCAERAIRVPDDVAQLESHMWLHKRGFKTHRSQIVCLLGGIFSINPFLKSAAWAVVQTPGFLSVLWPTGKGQMVTRLTNHQQTLSGMWSQGKEKGQGTMLEIHEAVMRRESTLCILQSVHAVWQVLPSCQHHSSGLISLSSCKFWEASRSQEILIIFVCSFWADSEQKTFFKRNFLETVMLFFDSSVSWITTWQRVHQLLTLSLAWKWNLSADGYKCHSEEHCPNKIIQKWTI